MQDQLLLAQSPSSCSCISSSPGNAMVKENMDAHRPQKIFTSLLTILLTFYFFHPFRLDCLVIIIFMSYLSTEVIFPLYRQISNLKRAECHRKQRNLLQHLLICLWLRKSFHHATSPPYSILGSRSTILGPRERPFKSYIQQVDYLFCKCHAKAAFDSLARKIKHPFTTGSTGDGFWWKS